jgi:hypothetical protein
MEKKENSGCVELGWMRPATGCSIKDDDDTNKFPNN